MSEPRVCTVTWLDGEREAFLATLFPEDMKYYVKEAVITRCRDHADAMPRDEWTALLARGFHAETHQIATIKRVTEGAGAPRACSRDRYHLRTGCVRRRPRSCAHVIRDEIL
jgi:hypothetical protein